MALSEARKRANAKYTAKAYDRVELKIPKGAKDKLKAIAEAQEQSLNGYIKQAINNQLAQDKQDLKL